MTDGGQDQARAPDDPGAGSGVRGAWVALGRAQMSSSRAYWSSMSFLAVGAVGVAYERFTGELLGTTPLAMCMMLAYGIGELSGRPGHVALARVVAGTLFLAVIAAWFVGASALV